MPEPGDGRHLRNLATVGLGVGGFVAFFSGIAVAFTLVRGVPRPLLGLFVVAAGIALVSVAVLLVDQIRRR